MHLSGHRLTPLSYSRSEPTPTPTWVSGDTRQQGSFSEEEEVEEQRERSQQPRTVLQVLCPYGRNRNPARAAPRARTRGVASRREEERVEQGDHTGGYEYVSRDSGYPLRLGGVRKRQQQYQDRHSPVATASRLAGPGRGLKTEPPFSRRR
jgi:hypothetical protein